ncbi:hypothetical protein RJ640_022264, partial [Escallonia rubra]
ANIIFVSVNTPTKTHGLRAEKAVDLAYWEIATLLIPDVLKSAKIFVERSTVPVKTAQGHRKESN